MVCHLMAMDHSSQKINIRSSTSVYCEKVNQNPNIIKISSANMFTSKNITWANILPKHDISICFKSFSKLTSYVLNLTEKEMDRILVNKCTQYVISIHILIW